MASKTTWAVTLVFPGERPASGEVLNIQGRSPTRSSKAGSGGLVAGVARMTGERGGLDWEGENRTQYWRLGATSGGSVYAVWDVERRGFRGARNCGVG